MAIETEEILGRGLQILSRILLTAGALLLSPFLMLLVAKLAVKAAPSMSRPPSALFGGLLILGSLAVLAPLLTIPGCGLWIQMKTGDRDKIVRYYKVSFLRYAPVLALGAGFMLYVGRTSAFSFVGIYGVIVMAYAGWLLRHDRIASHG